MPDRLAGIVGQQVMLGSRRRIPSRISASDEERLILGGRTSSGIDSHHPRVVEHRIDIETTPRNGKGSGDGRLPDLKFGGPRFYHYLVE